jgi:hypothetical protein
MQHRLEIRTGVLGSVAIGLVDHEDIGDLHQPRLVGLNRISPSRIHHDHGGVGSPSDVDFHLADTHGLHHDRRPSDRIENPYGLGGGE